MVVIAFAAHLLFLAVLVMIGEFRLRPSTPEQAYTVEIVSDGELGGHMPAGLPKLELGGQEPPKKQLAKQAPAPRPQPPPEAQKEPPPPPPPPAELQAAVPAPEPKTETAPALPKAEPPASDKPPREDDLVLATATPTPAPTARPTAVPTARPTAAPTARPTAAPTAAPTPSPHPTEKPAPRPSVSARPSAVPPRPSATPTVKPQRPSDARSPEAAPRATASPVIVVKPLPTQSPGSVAARRSPQAAPTSAADARIAEALERVQRNVGERAGSGTTTGDAGVRAPNADARGTGGIGGSDAPDSSRRVGIGPGRGGAGELRGVEFLLYYNRMLSRIREAWVYTGGATNAEVEVRFRVLDDGVVADLRVTQPSGDPPYDASVVRAVRAASPLGPPPAKYRTDFSDVVLTFRPGDLKAAP